MSEDFSKIWASDGDVTAPSDTQYNQGFSFLGSAPPPEELFNYLFQKIDQKLLQLFNTSRQWKASTAYAVGDIVFSENADSYKYMECTVAGTSGTIEPTWPEVGSTVADGTVTWIAKRVANNIPYNRQIYTTNGIFTFTAPVTGLYKVLVVGGGGGGGGATSASGNPAGAGGGGGGGYAIKSIYLTAGTTVSVTVGSGGTVVSGSNGNAGGTSSFGAYCSATGGFGGGYATSAMSSTVTAGNRGGVGSNGDINGYGGTGHAGFCSYPTTASPTIGGAGGMSVLSSGSMYNSGTIYDGTLGSGGAGAIILTTGSAAGGNGASGAVIIEW